MAKKKTQLKNTLPPSPKHLRHTSLNSSQIPSIPIVWVAIIIPIICLVGHWSPLPAATPMEYKSIVAQAYLAILLLIYLWLKSSETNTAPALEFSIPRIILAALFILGTLSLLWAINAEFWVYKWTKWYAALAIFILGLQVAHTKKNIDTLFSLVLCGGLITAVIGIAQYLFGFNQIPQTSPPASTFGNGNMAGQVMVFTFPLPLYFLLSKQLTLVKTWFYALSVSILLAFVFYTKTRAIWIACGLEIFLMALFIALDNKRHSWLLWSRQKTIASLCALGIFFLLINLNQNGFDFFWETAAKEISSIGTDSQSKSNLRYVIWLSALDIVKDFPILGTGLGNFFDVVNRDNYFRYPAFAIQRVHNDTLEHTVELGLIGLLLLIALFISIMIVLIKLFNNSKEYQRLAYALLSIVLIANLLNAQLSFPYQLPVPFVIAPLFLAFLVRGYELNGGTIHTIAIKGWAIKGQLVLGAMITIFILVNHSFWAYDLKRMNAFISSGGKLEPWRPKYPIYNQSYLILAQVITTRSGDLLKDRVGNSFMNLAIDYWPDSFFSHKLQIDIALKQRNWDILETVAAKMALTQQPNEFYSEYYLQQKFLANREMDKYREIYERLSSLPESTLKTHPLNFTMLHTMAINLRDREKVPHFFKQLNKHWHNRMGIATIINHALFLFRDGQKAAAIPFMKQSLLMQANHQYANYFKQNIAKHEK